MHQEFIGAGRLNEEIIRCMGDGLLVFDQKGLVREINPATESLFGYSSREILGNTIEQLIPGILPRDHAPARLDLDGQHKSGCSIPLSVQLHSVEVGDNCYYTGLIRTRDESGAGDRTSALLRRNQELHHQISERQAMQAALQASEQRLRSVVNNAPVILFAVDLHGTLNFVAGKGLERLDTLPEKLTGQSMFRIFQRTPNFRRDFQRILAGEQFSSILEISDLVFECYYSPTHDDKGRVSGVIGVATDVTERKQAEQRLVQLANFDSLTGLPNRALFRDRLSQALAKARRKRCQTALLFLDLDRFKMINDSLGHHAGDQLLQSVASRLQHTARRNDTVARLGGDEFTLILEDLSSAEDATTVARKILEVMNKPFTIDGHEMFVTTSIGIAVYPDDGDDMEELLKNADTAMYRAKEQGRNNYRFYTADMNAKAVEHLIMENRMRHALERNEFVLCYQPQIDLHSQEITGLEALIRWQHPDLGLLYPNQFLPLAEDAGFIREVGEWTLYQACAQGVRWQQQGLAPMRIAVNLSPQQFTQPDLVENVTRVLRDTGLSPDLLELEITENFLAQDVDKAILTLKALHELGVQLAIDDFGTGYSSLSYLQKFPVSTLKIDRSFVRDIVEAGEAPIAEAIIGLARTLRLRVMAEGVETDQQLYFLRQRGCDEAQGFLLGEPLAADDVADWCRDTAGYRSVFDQASLWPGE